MDPSGIQVVLGYADGVVRLFAIESETDPTQLTSGTMYRLTKALQAKSVKTGQRLLVLENWCVKWFNKKGCNSRHADVMSLRNATTV